MKLEGGGGNGLHASSKQKIGSDTVQWADVGSTTVSQAADVIQKHQPLFLTLNFARNNEARLLPLARGHFASSAPVDLFAYGSRIGEMPAYSTIINTLQGLSDQDAASVAKVQFSSVLWHFLRTENWTDSPWAGQN